MAEPNDTLELCAYLSGIMIYHKLTDDRQDERGGKRLVAGLAMPYANSLRKKAIKKGLGQVDARVAESMRALAELERERPVSADRPAELFGELMAYLFAYGLTGDTQKIARNVGKHIGRWVYLVDAIDDFEEDRKKGRYNPYLCLWQNTDMTHDRRKTLENALIAELTAVETALDLCDTDTAERKTLWGVVHNVLYLGMPVTARKILFPEVCEHTEANSKNKKRKTTCQKQQF